MQPASRDRGTEDADYLRRCGGMTLGGRAGEMWLAFLGPGGNGKSTFIRGLGGVMGEYAQPCRVEMFLEQRYSGGTGPTPEEAVLPSARVYLAPEPKPNSTLDAGKIKGLTGGDVRQANPKNKDLFNYIPVGVPIFQANKLPNVNDPSEGFWRRVNIVNFDVAMGELPVGERRTDAQIEAMLLAERPGMLNWFLQGYAEFRDVGLMAPARVAADKKALRALADPVGEFLDDCTVRQTGERTQTAALHKAFLRWSEMQNEKGMGAKAFTATMLAMRFIREKSSDWYWLGLHLRDEGSWGAGDG